jgi:CRISPR type I-E-associated protein CasB/Cse2
MAEHNTHQPRLIAYLKHLAENDDRAPLARLRASLQPGRELEALPFVVSHLPTKRDQAPLSPAVRQRNEDDAILVAALFALHPEDGRDSLAEALRHVRAETGSDSVEARFRALLSAGRAELDTHLRHAVSLVASKHHAIDWLDLYRTIASWDSADQRARRAWARDFWAPPFEAPEGGDDAATAGSEPR